MLRPLSSPPPNRSPEPDDVASWSDERVIESLARDDPAAGAMLYDRLVRVVEWTIVRIVGGRSADHEDLIQTSFEQIFVTLRRGRYARRCSLTSWASALSCHVALNALRAERRRGRLRIESERIALGADAGSGSDDPDGRIDARRRLRRIRIELSRMDPGRAEVLLLHEVSGLPLADIATLLGISRAAAQSRLSRGRRELLSRLRDAGIGTDEEGS